MSSAHRPRAVRLLAKLSEAVSARAAPANAKSRDWHNRLSKITREVMKLDLTNPRGQRGIIDRGRPCG